MGRDKRTLTVGRAPLIQRVHDALSPYCSEVLIVGGSTGLPALSEARLVPDLRPGREGPLAGLESGLLAASHERVFLAASDMPFVPVWLVARALELLGEGAPAVVPRSDRVHPLCAAYRRGMAPEVGAALDDGVRAMREFLRGIEGVRYVEGDELSSFGDPAVFLMNVNSPEDLARARALEER